MPIHRRGIASSVVAVGAAWRGLGSYLDDATDAPLDLLHQYFSLAPDAIPIGFELATGHGCLRCGRDSHWNHLHVVLSRFSSQHRRVNRAEREWIQGGSQSIAIDSNSLSSPSQQDRGMRFPPLLAMAASVPLWLTCFVQFASNFGWAFLVTKMPTYLSEVYGSSPQSQSWLQSIPLAAGIPGLFLGGFFTDLFVRRFGLRWGRSIAMGVSRLAVATAFASTFIATSAEMATLCFVWMSFRPILGTPRVLGLLPRRWWEECRSGPWVGQHVGQSRRRPLTHRLRTYFGALYRINRGLADGFRDLLRYQCSCQPLCLGHLCQEGYRRLASTPLSASIT